MAKKPTTPKTSAKSSAKAAKPVENINHRQDTRKNIPSADLQSLVTDEHLAPIEVSIKRRNRDLDPQLVWRGKEEADERDLTIKAPPIYIQERIKPKTLIDDLRHASAEATSAEDARATGNLLFAEMKRDFNGLPSAQARTEFYQHEGHWSNRMILGDSLQVMASLAEKEELRGKVQCIYFDPPYGIKFNSNFQWSTTSRDVKDGKADHITREPEQVKAFRDTWRDGIHSYLAYIRDRLEMARELLTESGSIFVQIGDENVHRVRAVMDEVFGEENFCAAIACQKTTSANSPSGKTNVLPGVYDTILWFAKEAGQVKYRVQYLAKTPGMEGATGYTNIEFPDGSRRTLSKTERHKNKLPDGARAFSRGDTRSTSGVDKTRYTVHFEWNTYRPHPNVWKTSELGMRRLIAASRITASPSNLYYIRYLDDFPAYPVTNVWTDVQSSFMADRHYVVQTPTSVVKRCILMATDPGDLVLDPTCGSGTTAYVAEQWGRRWITIDTSRVALALARARIMGARYPYYLLADSEEGQRKEADLAGTMLQTKKAYHNVRLGFVYERVPHITLKSIANNAEIDVIWENHLPQVTKALADLNASLRQHKTPFVVREGGRKGKKVDFCAKADGTFTMPSGEKVPAFEMVEWEVPREAPADWPPASRGPLEAFWQARIARQKAMDASIAAKAEFECLYDKPYEDKKKVRVAGPFTVESLSPHRMLGFDQANNVIDPNDSPSRNDPGTDFAHVMLEQLRLSGVQQAHKEDKLEFSSIEGWAGKFLCAVGQYTEGEGEDQQPKRAGIFIGPEFGTVSRQHLVDAAREAGDAGFDVVIACGFSFDAHSSEFNSLGRVPVLRATMNADLHMAGDLKNTGKGNLFVVFGEPDISVEEADEGKVIVGVAGVDVYDPKTGKIRSDDPDSLAMWFIDTNYDGECFFVCHAYFLGANDPYGSLKKTLKAEINEEVWQSLYSDTSRPFDKPKSGKIAVKVINHLGDEVLKVMEVK